MILFPQIGIFTTVRITGAMWTPTKPSITPALLLFDVYKAQLDQSFLDTLTANNILYLFVPPNCTDLKNEFLKWYSNEMAKKLMWGVRGPDIVVDMKMSTVKPVSIDWIISAHKSIKPETIIQGFEKASLLGVFNENPLLNFLPSSSMLQFLYDTSGDLIVQ